MIFVLAFSHTVEAVVLAKRQLSEDSKTICVHAVLVGYRKSLLIDIFRTSKASLNKWIKRFKDTGSVTKKRKTTIPKKFQQKHMDFIILIVEKNPLFTLFQIKQQFERYFTTITISVSTVWRILIRNNYSYKVLQRRAIDIKLAAITSFTEELNNLSPLPEQLLFLDEMSLDNRDMFKKKGFFRKGEDPIYFGVFRRSERISILSFADISGFVSTYETEGTFTRKIFFDKIQLMVNTGLVSRYPGPRSIWILDGAKIHLDENIVYFLRSVGLRMVFLPPYFCLLRFLLQNMARPNSPCHF